MRQHYSFKKIVSKWDNRVKRILKNLHNKLEFNKLRNKETEG